MRALVIATVCLALAVPASAFPIQVLITVTTTGTGSQPVARGGFIFDSSYFVQDPGTTFSYFGYVPVSSLKDAGLDWFAGPLAGTHWDVLGYGGSDHLIVNYNAPIELGRYSLGHPGYDWGWMGDIGGELFMGGDGLSLFDVDGVQYSASWTGQAIPEPTSWTVFLAGLAGLIAARARRTRRLYRPARRGGR